MNDGTHGTFDSTLSHQNMNSYIVPHLEPINSNFGMDVDRINEKNSKKRKKPGDGLQSAANKKSKPNNSPSSNLQVALVTKVNEERKKRKSILRTCGSSTRKFAIIFYVALLQHWLLRPFKARNSSHRHQCLSFLV